MASLQERYDAAERVEMRRWLRSRGNNDHAMGHGPEASLQLVHQVMDSDGDIRAILARGRARVDEHIAASRHGEYVKNGE